MDEGIRARLGLPGADPAAKVQPGTISDLDARRWAREFGLDPDQEVDPDAEF